MDDAKRLKILGDTRRTVFSASGLRDLWQDKVETAKAAAKRMVKKGALVKLAKGYYSLRKDFDIWELANLVISPSYISLNSALFYRGVSFQAMGRVTSVATLNYEREIGDYLFKYYAMKDTLFFNLEGVDYRGGVSIARPERAILDCFYFGILPNIDNPEKIKKSYLRKISTFYPKTVRERALRVL